MSLELYQILLLIAVGALVGISMSFLGQTGQGVVIPAVLLITGDVLLAIAISVLNDLITASSVGIGYVKNRQFKFRKDILLLVIVAIFGSFLGVLILMTTPLGNIFGWALPVVIILLGLIILKNGFPTSETLKKMAKNIAQKVLKNRGDEERLALLDKKFEEQNVVGEEEIQGIIPPNSRLFYILAIGFGFYVGLNSGMFGANSGMILALVLIMLYGYPLKKGVGTALMLSIIVCIFTFFIYQFLGFAIKGRGYFNLEITLYLAIGAVTTGLFASTFVQKMSAKAMGRGMAIAMLALGTVSLMFYFAK